MKLLRHEKETLTSTTASNNSYETFDGEEVRCFKGRHDEYGIEILEIKKGGLKNESIRYEQS